jgi:hypothetical protein
MADRKEVETAGARVQAELIFLSCLSLFLLSRYLTCCFGANSAGAGTFEQYLQSAGKPPCVYGVYIDQI